MAELFVKGHALRQHLDLLLEWYGIEMGQRILTRLSPDFRLAVEENAVTRSGWYPIAWANELHDAALREVPGASDLPERLSREGVERDMKGIYGFLARLVTPEFCIKQAPRILSTYFRGVEVTATILGSERAELVFVGTAGIGRYLWRDIMAGAQRIFEAAGATNVILRTREGGDEADDRHVIDVRWG